jgi:hypothetical protein
MLGISPVKEEPTSVTAEEKAVAMSRSASYQKMLRKQQERQLARQDSNDPPRTLSVWSSLGYGGEKHKNGSDDSVVSAMTANTASSFYSFRAVRPPRIKKKRIKSQTIAQNLERKASRFSRKQTTNNSMPKALASKLHSAEEFREDSMEISSDAQHVAPTYASKKQQEKEKRRGRRKLMRLGRKVKRAALLGSMQSGNNDAAAAAPHESHAPMTRDIPLLTMVSAGSNDPLPFVYSASYNSKDHNPTKLETTNQTRELNKNKHAVKPIPGRPPLHPKSKTSPSHSPKEGTLEKNATKMEDKSAFSSGITTKDSVLSLMSANMKMNDFPVVFTTLSRASSLGSLDLPKFQNKSSKFTTEEDIQPTFMFPSGMMDKLILKLWDAVETHNTKGWKQDLSSQSFHNFLLEDDNYSDISSSEDDWSDSSDDDNDDDEEEEYDDDSLRIFLKDSRDEEVGQGDSDCDGMIDEEDEAYYGGNDDVMLGMKHMYMAEIKDMEQTYGLQFVRECLKLFVVDTAAKDREEDEQRDVSETMTSERDDEEPSNTRASF